ncbi:MAG: sigma-54 dependent transcriptional regulator [SAR324 cluster bacterium]|nr:sigma-54 dependent transcriptional regulator [SAR324 cluster bacterium]MDP6765107.1 sigma-54 dependent transcriptional regulator [SAR324 cluster bacterium]
MRQEILLVDDDPSMRNSISRSLVNENYHILLANTLQEGRRLFEKHNPEVLLLDLKLPDGDGRELFHHIRENNPELPVIILTAFPDTQGAISLMKKGAFDYLVKPFDLNELKIQIRKGLELLGLKNEVLQLRQGRYLKNSVPSIMGNSRAIHELKALIAKVAPSDASVLITGESGTGKELVAEHIHHLSPRSDSPLIPINCAAIPETLLEGELFGTEKGAYTGADSSRKGMFELAHHGSLLLDEIGEMPRSLQPKLLRVLETLQVKRLGGKKEIQVDARVISATNQDFSVKLQEGSFREDLFYRLNIFPIHIPPLRQRKEDLPELANHFLNYYAHQFRLSSEGFTETAMNTLVHWCWPGNVRELKNLVERLVILYRENSHLPKIENEFLPPELKDLPPENPPQKSESQQSINTGRICSSLSEIEEQHIRNVFSMMRFNKTITARNLGISRNTLKKKLAQYGIEEN